MHSPPEVQAVVPGQYIIPAPPTAATTLVVVGVRALLELFCVLAPNPAPVSVVVTSFLKSWDSTIFTTIEITTTTQIVNTVRA
jgi:hypothetical protein